MRKLIPLLIVLLLRFIEAYPATPTLKFYDASGNPLSLAEVQSAMKGSAKIASDAWVSRDTLKMVTWNPVETAGSLAVTISPDNPAFAITWPTATHGYSYWIMDHQGTRFDTTDTANVNLQLADSSGEV
jgi:hypothetical protein